MEWMFTALQDLPAPLGIRKVQSKSSPHYDGEIDVLCNLFIFFCSCWDVCKIIAKADNSCATGEGWYDLQYRCSYMIISFLGVEF